MNWKMTMIVGLLAACIGATAQRQFADVPSDSGTGDTSAIISPAMSDRFEAVQPVLPRPSLEQILVAGRFELRGLLAHFLPSATIEELETVLGNWGPTVNRDRTSILMWKMLLARWVELDAPGALAVEKATQERRLNGWCYQMWVLQAPLDALASARTEENTESLFREFSG